MRSTRASLRKLRAYALEHPSGEGAVQAITRTLKLKVDVPPNSELQHALNAQFTAFDTVRRQVLAELEEIWTNEPDEFIAMVKATAKKPYQNKTTCAGWLLNRFLTGMKTPEFVSRKSLFALLNNISGNLKSFISRRENVAADIAAVINANQKLWEEVIPATCEELEIDQYPPNPPAIDAENLSEEAVGQYNQWAGQANLWYNLILSQKHHVTTDEVARPKRIRGYPGFPGSQVFREREPLDTAIEALAMVCKKMVKANLPRFKKLNAKEWAEVLERFPVPEVGNTKPKGARLKLGKRLSALIAAHPEWKPVDYAREILEGHQRATEKLLRHLQARGFYDRQAINKLFGLINTSAVFVLEPLRVRGDYVGYRKVDWPRLEAYGHARGALHEAGDESVAIEVSGFSVTPKGVFNYTGTLAYQPGGRNEQWVFALNHPQGLKSLLGPDTLKQTKRDITPYIGFGTQGGSRKKALSKPKEYTRNRLWVDAKLPPLILPLQFGTRIGREYFWNFDNALKEKDDWMLANGRVIREMRPNRPDLSQYYVALTFQKETPPPANPPAGKLIGIDRGEATPAAYALIDDNGGVIKTGKIAKEYREQQRKYEEKRREFQRTRGGYARWLKAKERNRARSLGGEVGRALLHLISEHQAPVVLERLSSGLATRGGKGLAMSYLQYERMIGTLEQKLAEAGCCKIPPQGRRPNNNYFLNLVNPAYTSQTCSECGHVHDSDFYEALALSLQQKSDESWQVTLGGDATRQLPASYHYVNWRFRIDKTIQTQDKLGEILKGQPVTDLPQSRLRKLINLIQYQLLPYRPEQAKFKCIACEHEADADEQAAINIARKHLLMQTLATDSGESTQEQRRDVREKWGQWYRERVERDWN